MEKAVICDSGFRSSGKNEKVELVWKPGQGQEIECPETNQCRYYVDLGQKEVTCMF